MNEWGFCLLVCRAYGYMCFCLPRRQVGLSSVDWTEQNKDADGSFSTLIAMAVF